MSSSLDTARIEPASSLVIRSGEVVHAAIASLWRRKLLITMIVATALALGVIAVLTMPPRYTAQAYLRGVVPGSNTVAKDDTDGSTVPVGLDLGRVIETQTRLLQSYQLAHRVVEQVGLNHPQPELKDSPSLLSNFFGQAADVPGQQEDKIATRILRRLSVTSDPRAYLITVKYTDRDPQLAAVMANAFVAELLRSIKLQNLSRQRSAAQAALAKQLAKFGDKHPKVAEARMGLAATDDLMKEELSDAPETVLQAAGESVTKAIVAPSSPNLSFVIGFCLLMGLAAGIGIALWLERDRWWLAFSSYYAGPFA
jgi:uncharacterized protein involved in exopolysaccharide biosynthesis